MKNVCIVGYGSVGPVHAQSLALLPHAKIYGICDIERERADLGAVQYGCKPFYSLEKCLKDDQIDVFHICTPHFLHYEMIEKCAKAGKEVVTEKPITMKKEEFETLARKYSQKPIYPIIQNRTNQCVVMLKDILSKEHSFGKLKAVKGILTWFRDENYYKHDSWRGTKAYEGGGVLINQAIHTLDLMIYLAGDVESVQATMSNKSLADVIEVEDTVDARLQFQNGAVGIFYATNAYGENSSVQLELEFENASFRYQDGVLYQNRQEICRDENKFLGRSYWGCGHERVFYDLYEHRKAFVVEDIRNTMQTMFAMYESAEKGKQVGVGK